MRSRLLENGSVKTDLCEDIRGNGDLQSLWPASSDMSGLAGCCCIALIACGIGLFHTARASSRLTSVHVNTYQNNSGCEVLQRVYRPAGRSYVLKMRICVYNNHIRPSAESVMKSHNKIILEIVTEQSIMHTNDMAPKSHVDIPRQSAPPHPKPCASITTLHNPCAPTETPQEKLERQFSRTAHDDLFGFMLV